MNDYDVARKVADRIVQLGETPDKAIAAVRLERTVYDVGQVLQGLREGMCAPLLLFTSEERGGSVVLIEALEIWLRNAKASKTKA